MNKTCKSGFLYLLISYLILLTSCEKKFDEYYSVPDNLVGSVLDVLRKDGNYTQFIKAVEMVDYDDILGKTGNFTVFAPDDAAFKQFFFEKHIDSLQQIPPEELKEIVMYHILFWSYSRFKLQYGLGVEDANVNYNTANFRKQTQSRPLMTEEYDTLGNEYTVYHDYKYIPVYFDEFFTDLNLDATENYSFFYPGSTYTGLNADRASVTEWDVAAQNGWIHRIDKVIVPPGNHEEILADHPEFSTFRSLMGKKVGFNYNDQITREQANNKDLIIDSVFLKHYELFPDLISPNTENLEAKGQSELLTVFAPTNSALQNFFLEHTKGYKSLNEIAGFFMDWYLLHYFGEAFWPSQLGKMTTEWAQPLTSSLQDGNISTSDIEFRQMASNGPFYGLNRYLLPRIFETVVQPIFGDKNYEWFCELLVFYQIDLLLNNENIDFTVFAPSNQAMTLAGYSARNGLGGFGLYSSQNPLSPVSRKRAIDIMKSHIVFGRIHESELQNNTYLKTIQNSYLGIKNGGIYGGGENIVTTMGSESESGLNGILIPVNRMLISPSKSILDILSDQLDYPETEEFIKLVQSAGLIIYDENYKPEALMNLATGFSYTCFVPDNNAIKKAIADGIIPSDPEARSEFIRYHFVASAIFSDGKETGIKNTTRYSDATKTDFNTITILNEPGNLRVLDGAGNIRCVTRPDIMATNGVVQIIDSMLFVK
jgi:uncharacterized surface protein with fasciclin (FAS1) repeats